MAKIKVETTSNKAKLKPAISPEDRDNQLIAMAYNAAEERLRNGTASAQEITFFLKQGSEREKRELERLELENELTKAKTRAIESADEIKDLYENAIAAMKLYSGNKDTEL